MNLEIPSERVIIPPDELEQRISDLLDAFFHRRIESLQDLKLDNKLKLKNPYLFRAIGVAGAEEIVKELLDAHISSSDETKFGNDFFEPLAKWVAERSFVRAAGTTVQTGAASGIDILISTPEEHQAIAIKSGTKVFNGQSRDTQIEEFRTLDRRLKKDRRHFFAIVGYCYGQKEQRVAKHFTEMAGQRLWEHLTGEEGFYLRIIRLMERKPIEHGPVFREQYRIATARFVDEFKAKYALRDGSIDWDKLVTMVSARRMPKAKATRQKAVKPNKRRMSRDS